MELYTIQNKRSANNIGKQIFRFWLLTHSLFILKIPLTWRRRFVIN